MLMNCPACGLRTDCPCPEATESQSEPLLPSIGELERVAYPGKLTTHALVDEITALLEVFKARPAAALDEMALSGILQSVLLPFGNIAQAEGFERYAYIMSIAATADEAWEMAAGQQELEP